jgi:branched-chain amino acid transport system permease protein
MGGIYALISMGLTMQYGVARILNVSHGEFIMVGAFITWMLTTMAGISPLLALIICMPVTFLIGYILHRTLYKKLKDLTPSAGAYEGNAMLISFGLMFIIQSVAQKIWGSSPQGYKYLTFSFKIGKTAIAVNRLFVLFVTIIISVIFYFFLNRTRMGKAIRASSQDPAAAGMMGIKINRVMAICFGIGAILAGIAGSLLSMINNINTSMGMNYTVIALIVVVLGGLGSIPGSLVGGLILGFVGSIVNRIDTSLYMVVFYVLIMVLLLVRPKGLLGR